jgi:phenylacetic acid degradation operon negative regulatory protein
LVFDLFGDYLRYRDGAVRLRSLVALMDAFEVPESTVCVVVTRMRNEGWLDSERAGRETTYRLTAGAWHLLDEGRKRIFERASEPWDGHWHMLMYSVPETDRAPREQLRKKLAWLGSGSDHCRPRCGSARTTGRARYAPSSAALPAW